MLWFGGAFLVFLLVFLGTSVSFAEDKATPQKFKVVYKIVFNDLTLSEAAKNEEKIKGDYFGSACKVEVIVEKESDGIVLFN